MKNHSLIAATFVLLAAAGCEAPQFCEEYPDLCPEGGGGNGDGGQPNGAGPQGGGGMTTTDGGGGDGGGGGIPDGCDPRIDATIGDDCGLFVDSDAVGAGEGTKSVPYQSLAAALSAASAGESIYVCQSDLNEAVTIGANVRIFGGLDCGSWAPTSTKTPWTGAPNEVPLSIEPGGSGTLIYNFAITAANGDGFDPTTLQGGSSISMIVDTATVTIDTVDLTAGSGAAGGDGEDVGGLADGRQSDGPAFDGNAGGGCGAAGGPMKSHICSAVTTRGGKGGDGDIGGGSSGISGSPSYGAVEPNGSPGAGESGSPWDCGSNQGIGETGHAGPVGTPGDAGVDLGTISILDGYVGAGGLGGQLGQPGQGGGGGGGRNGDGVNGCADDVPGPSGGSGGAGGCGGIGGGGAGAGGASIALASLNATLTLNSVTLTAGAGGAGGIGGNGQQGGAGGLGGPGGGVACTGGIGGSGGTGGAGGGGRGGHSIGLAYIGDEPSLSDDAILFAESPASGGSGGNGNTQGNAGAAGVALAKQNFE